MPEPVSAVGAISGPSLAPATIRQSMDRAVRAAAKIFATPPENVQRALTNGQSLADMALSRGVQRNELVVAISKVFQSQGGGLDRQSAKYLANKMIDSRGDDHDS